MKAAVYHGLKDIRVQQMPDPIPTADNMVAEVICCAICGTDLKTYTVGNPKYVPPIIIGHEMVGRLTHIGANVSGFAPGDYITLATTVSCGECAYCAMGLENLCLNAKPISSHFNGAFAESIEIPPLAITRGNVIKIPAGSTPIEHYALSEPLSCVVNAFENANVRPGDSIAIIGSGPLGALHAEYAKAIGASQVFVVGNTEIRLELMRRIRGVTLIDGKKQNVAGTLKEATGGLGVDCAMICAPVASAFEGAPQYVRKGGSICFFASLPEGACMLQLNSRPIHYNELRLVGTSDSRKEHVQRAVDLIACGKIDCASIITHSIPLDRILDGFELMRSKQCLKTLVWTGREHE